MFYNNNNSDSEISQIGKELLGSKFVGVFPLDKVELKEGAIIVNTQSETLPGEHWIAINITPLKINVFDPLGTFYPSSLVRKLAEFRRKTIYNNAMIQNPQSNTCGEHCLIWLYNQYKH